ncbi:MAG: 6-carboxytetrahydropterin synthase [Coriobacteriales bacterium]|nr:6-carboxytetrahydropterin synthase [Coriobacteriales bacterium]
MTYTLKTQNHFDSAHFLSDYHGKCENLHGHRWIVEAEITSAELQTQGDEKDMVCDFSSFKDSLNEICKEFDHTFLIEESSLAKTTIEALEQEGFSVKILPYRTTAENFAKDIFEKLAKCGMPVSKISVYETPNNCAIYTK